MGIVVRRKNNGQGCFCSRGHSCASICSWIPRGYLYLCIFAVSATAKALGPAVFCLLGIPSWQMYLCWCFSGILVQTKFEPRKWVTKEEKGSMALLLTVYHWVENHWFPSPTLTFSVKRSIVIYYLTPPSIINGSWDSVQDSCQSQMKLSRKNGDKHICTTIFLMHPSGM